MKTRNILYVLTLIAYTLSLAHSVIPHHHHTTAEEATAHEHSHDHHEHPKDHGHGHSHQQHDQPESEGDSSGTGHFFFFNHGANGDVLVRHISLDNPVKSKKVQIEIPVDERVVPFIVGEHLVFHPPQRTGKIHSATLSASSLRGPPSCLA